MFPSELIMNMTLSYDIFHELLIFMMTIRVIDLTDAYFDHENILITNYNERDDDDDDHDDGNYGNNIEKGTQ